MRNPNLIQVTKKSNPHMLFEKTTEIFPAESNLCSYGIQGKLFHIMFVYICDDFPYRIIGVTDRRSGLRERMYRKISN